MKLNHFRVQVRLIKFRNLEILKIVDKNVKY